MDARLAEVFEKVTGQQSGSQGIFKAIGFVFVPHSDSNPPAGNFNLIAENGSGTLEGADAAMMALISAAFGSGSQTVGFTLKDDGRTIDRVVVSGFYG